MTLRTSLILASFLLSSLPAISQQRFTIREAIDYSLKNHGSNAIYNNKVEITKQQSKEALSGYLPQVNANVTFDDNLQRQTTVIPGAAFGSKEDMKVQFGNKYNTNAAIQLDQTIYDQALLYGIKAGVPAKKIAELNKAKNDETLIYNTVAAYSQILILREQQKLLNENANQYKELYNITKFRFDKGVAKKVDLDKITVNINNIAAQQKQILTDLDVAYNSLKNAMGVPLSSDIEIDASLDHKTYLNIPKETVDVANRIEYQLQEQNIQLQEIDVKRKQAASLPTVSGYARYGGQAFGNEFNTAVTNWNNYSAIGLKINVPLFSGRRRESQVQQSKLELLNAKQNLELSTEQLQLQFQNANKQLQNNITTVSTNRNNMELAKSVYETSQLEYNKGVSSMTDLLNADFSYKQAQTNYITSLLNLVANRLQYEQAKGTIKEFINKL